jgi:DNA-directed RNA polymerase subunit M/transcription elongation factor TFIIS
MSYRKQSKEYLSEFLSKKDINNIEKIIFSNTKNIKQYNDLLYEIIGEIILGKNLKDIILNINNGYFSWNNKLYTNIKHNISEQNDFIENPFEVEEGVIECNKCGSKRVFSYSKQTRGADEPMTTFAQCVSCKSSWSYSG